MTEARASTENVKNGAYDGNAACDAEDVPDLVLDDLHLDVQDELNSSYKEESTSDGSFGLTVSQTRGKFHSDPTLNSKKVDIEQIEGGVSEGNVSPKQREASPERDADLPRSVQRTRSLNASYPRTRVISQTIENMKQARSRAVDKVLQINDLEPGRLDWKLCFTDAEVEKSCRRVLDQFSYHVLRKLSPLILVAWVLYAAFTWWRLRGEREMFMITVHLVNAAGMFVVLCVLIGITRDSQRVSLVMLKWLRRSIYITGAMFYWGHDVQRFFQGYSFSVPYMQMLVLWTMHVFFGLHFRALLGESFILIGGSLVIANVFVAPSVINSLVPLICLCGTVFAGQIAAYSIEANLRQQFSLTRDSAHLTSTLARLRITQMDTAYAARAQPPEVANMDNSASSNLASTSGAGQHRDTSVESNKHSDAPFLGDGSADVPQDIDHVDMQVKDTLTSLVSVYTTHERSPRMAPSSPQSHTMTLPQLFVCPPTARGDAPQGPPSAPAHKERRTRQYQPRHPVMRRLSEASLPTSESDVASLAVSHTADFNVLQHLDSRENTSCWHKTKLRVFLDFQAPEMERRFAEDRLNRTYNPLRLVVFCNFMADIFLGVQEYFILPHGMHMHVLGIRFGHQCAVMLLILTFMSTRFYTAKSMQPALCLWLCFMGAGNVWLITVVTTSAPLMKNFYIANLMRLLMHVQTTFRLRFAYTSLVSCVTLVIFFVTSWLTRNHVPPGAEAASMFDVLYDVGRLGAVIVMGACLSYVAEHRVRLTFVLRTQKEDVESQIAKLQSRVVLSSSTDS